MNCGKNCYLWDTITARGRTIKDQVWSKFRDLVPLLASRSLPLLAKCKLYSACVVSDILYGGETWPLKEEGLIRIDGNDARMVRVMMQDADLKIGLLARNIVPLEVCP